MSEEDTRPAVVDAAERTKWLSFIAFIVADVIQILFVAILYLDSRTLFVVGIDISRSSPLVSTSVFVSISVMQIIMIYTFAVNIRYRNDMIQLYPKTPNIPDWPCRYSCSEIVKWTTEIARASGLRVKEIYMARSPLPNAFTFSLPILGSIVVVNSNILDLLREDEMRAIIAHEIGHIRNHDSIMSILMRIPTAFVEVIYVYVYLRLVLSIVDSIVIYFDLVSALIRAGILLAFIGLSRLLIIVVMIFIQRAARQAELLADYHAATVLGPNVTVNALLVLGQRIEAVSALIQELQRLEAMDPSRRGRTDTAELMTMLRSYPLDGIDEEVAREMAPAIFLRTRLMTLRKIYGIQFDDEQIEQAIAPAVESLRKSPQAQSSKQQELKRQRLLDWRTVDHDRNRRLTDAELSELIQLMRAHPDRLLFSNELGQYEILMEHPNLRQRILFLASAFGL